MSLKIEKYGSVRIVITVPDPDAHGPDNDSTLTIYDGTPDVDCIIEAMAFYAGEEVGEVEEIEVPESHDPLEIYGTDSLENDACDKENDNLPEESIIISENYDEPGECLDEDWPSDDE